jgi:hypothetical protein
MVHLPKSGKVLLIDGYGYKGRGEMWSYDVQDNQWQLLAEGGPPRGPAPDRDWYPVPAAANAEDMVVTFLEDGKSGLATYAAQINPALVDGEGTAKRGVPPLAEKPYPAKREDPQWYEMNAPQPDPAAEEDWLKKLQPNTWVLRQSPNWPQIDYGGSRCWGCCVLDTDRDQFLHYGGGHATYDGNDVLHYSIRANRYFIGHRPEHTLNFAPNGIGLPACKSYQNRPFLSGHSYRCYAYDPTLAKLVLCAQKSGGKLFTYDPSAGDWEASLTTPFHKKDFEIHQYQTKCVGTAKGVIAWPCTGEGLWRVDAARMTWEKLPAQGKVGTPGWDTEGMVWDSKRDRLLLLSSGLKGDITAYDIKTGQVQLLNPAGKEHAGASPREAIYLSGCDAALVGARPGKGAAGEQRWLLYDCSKNAWLAVRLPGADPLGKEQFNVSLGLMYDPRRDLVWAVDMLSKPYVLRLDVKTADVRPLADGGK